jgi:hypothetical protein
LCLKTQSTADLKIKETRSAFHAKLRVGKRRGEIEDASNKSMDVRAKQRLCYQRVFLPFACPLRFRPTSSQPFSSHKQHTVSYQTYPVLRQMFIT